jgi:predicted nucleic acid-binding Zn finger protein
MTIDTGFLIGNERAARGLALAKTPNAVRKIPKLTSSTWQIWKVVSQTHKDILYTVIEKSDGTIECDCPDFINRKGLLLCKHILGCMYLEVIVK